LFSDKFDLIEEKLIDIWFCYDTGDASDHKQYDIRKVLASNWQVP
jgi:hypothetical protein